MYLKSLEVNGFKSFSKKTTLDFKTKISSIVGPNGSGKSNIAEAFRFVLGEQSIKNMRGKKGEDLIFTGKNTCLNRGSVKVTFNNLDKKLNIDYDEVVIERIVFRDGVNEYLINGTKVRAKDILELLTSANIGATGHHIISQGESDKILSISAKERKIVIEEALGLKSYVIKKTESQRKLLKTEFNLKEVKTREKINTPRIKFLKREVEKIEKTKDLKVELFELYSSFFPKKIEIENKILNLVSEVSNKEKNKNKIEEKISLKKGELIENKNININDQERNLKVSKILLEKKEIEEQKIKWQKKITRNEILIETELKKETDFNSQKEKVDENIKQYKEKSQKIQSIILHKIGNSFKENNFLQEISDDILFFFGIRKDGIINKNFDLILVKEKEKENLLFIEKISELNNVLESFLKKIMILNSNKEGIEEILSKEIEIEILKMEKILSSEISEISLLNSKKFTMEKELNYYKNEESFASSFFGEEVLNNFYKNNKIDNQEETNHKMNLLEKITRIRILLENSFEGDQNKILEEYNALVEREEFTTKEVVDLEKTKNDLNKLILDITKQIEEKFRIGVEKINKEFSMFFSTLFPGGKAEIFLTNILINKEEEDDFQEYELGIDMKVFLLNKKISGLSMLSGGERSLTSIALLFAMSSITPPPFIILDETDAALDEANSVRYGDMVEKLSEHSQLILITHNRETMSRAGVLYGVTMDDTGISKLLSVSLEEGIKYSK